MTYRLTPNAQEDAREYGLSVDAVVSMVKHAAPVTHEFGNRRFEKYVMQVDGSVVSSISLYQQTTTHGGKHDECEDSVP